MVAATADQDFVAATILRAAGEELARLALALTKRFGVRPVAVSGRASALHPSIVEAMRIALPADIALSRSAHGAHHAAARMALATESTTTIKTP
jgi:glucosamine kinase